MLIKYRIWYYHGVTNFSLSCVYGTVKSFEMNFDVNNIDKCRYRVFNYNYDELIRYFFFENQTRA